MGGNYLPVQHYAVPYIIQQYGEANRSNENI